MSEEEEEDLYAGLYDDIQQVQKEPIQQTPVIIHQTQPAYQPAVNILDPNRQDQG